RAGQVHQAFRIAGRLGIPVAAGADNSGGYYPYALGLPDEAAYWPEPIVPAPGRLEAALDLIGRSIDQGATVIGIGPLTNLALFDRAFPGRLRQAPLFLMGGYVYPVPPGFPQWGREDDFNFHIDVSSAAHVLTHARPTLIPLEITVQTAFRAAYLPDLRRAGGLAALVAHHGELHDREHRNAETHGRTCDGLPDDILNFQHDPLACAVALGWDGVTIEDTPLAIEGRDGLLHLSVDPDESTYPVVTAVDAPRFNDTWRDIVCS
ncbi:MAG TPA: nucleoside hydrolase, partial [Thermomicrobiales bacterium]|nr:nucleoside hydrolase [Thermomicrobiales bacterium]